MKMKMLISSAMVASLLLVSCGDSGEDAKTDGDKDKDKKESADTGKKEEGEKPPPGPTEEEKAEKAVAAFKAAIEEKKILETAEAIDAAETNKQEDPVAVFTAVKKLSADFGSIATDGLPEDLEGATSALQDGLAKMAAHIDKFPIPLDVLTGGEEAAGKWFLEQTTADADFQTKFEESMGGWETEMNAITDGLEDDEHEKVFEKYEIDIGLGDDEEEEEEEEEESPL